MNCPNNVPDTFSDALPELHCWSGRPTADDLAALPGCPALYLLVDSAGKPVQLASTQSLKRLLISRLTDPLRQRPGKADLAEIARGVRWRRLSTPFEGRWWYYRLAREVHPKEYRRLISFGPAYFLCVDWDEPAPELRVTERIWCTAGQFVGPWATHKACQEALQGLRDLFDLCRYPEQVRAAPRGTRCAYAEMGRCDAPCDGSAPLENYAARCRAAWRFAGGAVDEWMDGAGERMQRAAAERAYEQAGQIKQQVDFAHKWKTQWAGRVRPAERLNYLLGLAVTRRRAWKLYLFRRGHLADGPVVSDRRLVVDVRAWLGTELARQPEQLADTVRAEQTWLFCHFLFNREADAALMIALPDNDVPVGLEESLYEQAAASKRRRERAR